MKFSGVQAQLTFSLRHVRLLAFRLVIEGKNHGHENSDRALSGEVSTVARTELNIIGVGLLASVADLHGRQCNSPVARILTEAVPQREPGDDVVMMCRGCVALFISIDSS